ncbi:MAG: hypothetical protein ACI90V_001754, partial [Bacillariaceae sp.]
ITSLAIRTALQCTLRAQQKLSAKASRIEIMHYVQFNRLEVYMMVLTCISLMRVCSHSFWYWYECVATNSRYSGPNRLSHLYDSPSCCFRFNRIEIVVPDKIAVDVDVAALVHVGVG